MCTQLVMLFAVGAAADLILRVRLGNGTVRRVNVGSADWSLERLGTEAGAAGPLYRDAARTVAFDQATTVAAAGLRHGDIVYAPVAARAARDDWEPYPALSKRRRRRTKRISTLDDLAADVHAVDAEEGRVCSEARVDRGTIDALEASGAIEGLVYGIRTRDSVVCEVFARSEEPLAARLGLEVVGCAAKAGQVDARLVVKAARRQLEAMRGAAGSSGGPFPFVLLLVSGQDDLNVEAFEVSPTLVQMAAEDLLVEPTEDVVRLKRPALVAKSQSSALDPAWVYRPVPIVSEASAFAVHPVAPGDDRAVVRRALKPLLDDRIALTARCCDFALLLRLQRLLTTTDFDTLARVVRTRRTTPDTLLPPSFGAVFKQAILT